MPAGGGPPMFVVSETSKLRVYVNVPQSYVPNVPVGTKAQISCRNIRDRTSRRPWKLPHNPSMLRRARRAYSSSSTIRNDELMTGDFTNVTFDLPHPEIAINVPASALILIKRGLQVAIVGNDGRIVLRQVTIVARSWATRSRSVRNCRRRSRGRQSARRHRDGDKVRIAGARGKSRRRRNSRSEIVRRTASSDRL